MFKFIELLYENKRSVNNYYRAIRDSVGRSKTTKLFVHASVVGDPKMSIGQRSQQIGVRLVETITKYLSSVG